MHISKADIDDLKARVDIVDFIGQVVLLKKQGRSFVGLCPFIPEKTPSFTVNRETQLFNCFSCRAQIGPHETGVTAKSGGDVITFVMKWKGLSFPEAYAFLGGRTPSGSTPSVRSRKEGPPMRLSASKDGEPASLQLGRAPRTRLLGAAFNHWHVNLASSRDAQEMLESRALLDRANWRLYKLGCSTGSLEDLCGTEASEARQHYLDMGVFYETDAGSIREAMKGRVVVPFIGFNQLPTGVYGRSIRNELEPHHRLLKGTRSGLINPNAARGRKEIFLVEAPFDMLSMAEIGFHNTVPLCCADLSDDHIELVRRGGVQSVVIGLDSDDTGTKGAAKIEETLARMGVATRIVTWPAKDPNALLVEHGAKKAREIVDALLRAPKASDLPARSSEAARPTVSGSIDALPLIDVSSSPDGDGGVSVRGRNAEATPEPETTAPQSATSPATSAMPRKNGAHSPSLDALAARVARLVAGDPTAARAQSTAPSPHVARVRPTAPISAPVVPAPAVSAASAPAPEVSAFSSGLSSLLDDEAVFSFDDRRYEARGLARCVSSGSLRVTLSAERRGFTPPPGLDGSHLDSLDLAVHRQRAAFEKEASRQLALPEDVVHRDVKSVIGGLQEITRKRKAEALLPKQKAAVVMTKEEIAEALDFWRAPDLFGRIVRDFKTCGLVGEETNKLVTYIAACSRLLDRPLAVIIQSSSAAGKSSLMEALLAFLPDEMKEKYTAVSGKSLFYFDEGTVLSNKILAIVEEEGAEKATYPLKLLQSEGELIMASTGKDPATGKLVTKKYRVVGPVMIILTTTSFEIDPELENRCLRLSVDESREQTRAIHEEQRLRMTFEGYERKVEREKLRKRHQNAQRLLRKIDVHNPYAKALTFVDEKTRTRRDHDKYLTLIETIALMHQHQRPVYKRVVNGVEKEFVDVTLEDIELAGRLAGEVLGQLLDDLQPQTRRFLSTLDRMVASLSETTAKSRSELRFSRRDVLDLAGFTYEQVRVHMGRLMDREYVIVHRGTRGQSFVYELLYDGEGQDGRPFVLGLVDVEKLRQLAGKTVTAESLGGRKGRFGVPLGSHWGVIGVPLGSGGNGSRPAPAAASGDSTGETSENAQLPVSREDAPVTVDDRNGARRGPRLNLLRFPPREKAKDDEHREAPGSESVVTVVPIPKPDKRVPGGKSGRPLRRVYPDAMR